MNLPKDMILYICNFLKINDLISFKLISKKYNVNVSNYMFNNYFCVIKDLTINNTNRIKHLHHSRFKMPILKRKLK